ncbi:hypothetical protein, partial [Streptomyces chlorus]
MSSMTAAPSGCPTHAGKTGARPTAARNHAWAHGEDHGQETVGLYLQGEIATLLRVGHFRDFAPEGVWFFGSFYGHSPLEWPIRVPGGAGPWQSHVQGNLRDA